MRNQNDRLCGLIGGFNKLRHPIVLYRFRPFGLLDTSRRREFALPTGLPMIGAGIGVTGDYEDICVFDFHAPYLEAISQVFKLGRCQPRKVLNGLE
ncbi:hypothetical protein D3C79_946740 [compost metagenome]